MVEERTEEQMICMLREAFNFLDTAGNGRIASKELGSVMSALGENPTEIELQDMVNVMDLNKSGNICLHEFLEFMTHRANTEEDEICEAFHIFDTDGDGYISAAELRQIMTRVGEKLSDEEIEAMIREADTDGDGKVGYQEFLAMMIRK